MRFASRRLRSFLPVLFAVLLAFSQQQAVLHLLGHSFERLANRDRSGAPDQGDLVCAKCLAIAHLDHAADARPPVFVAPPSGAVAVPSWTAAPVASATVVVYRSRAPPASS